jgi:TRAP-type mannitol/chloroaromatic compound transport system permease small subunit
LRGIDRVNTFIGKSVMWLILLAVLVSAGNAIVRKVFNWSSNSLAGTAVVSVRRGLLGAAAYTLQQNEHIRIDMFYGTRTRRTQHWIDLIGHVFFPCPSSC